MSSTKIFCNSARAAERQGQGSATLEAFESSPVCLVSSDSGYSLNMERLMAEANQPILRVTRILEVNPNHGVIRALDQTAASCFTTGDVGRELPCRRPGEICKSTVEFNY